MKSPISATVDRDAPQTFIDQNGLRRQYEDLLGLYRKTIAERDDALSKLRQSSSSESERCKLRKIVLEAASKSPAPSESKSLEVDASEDPSKLQPQSFQFDAWEDVRFSSFEQGFDSVLHIFHAEWFGIRAAAGSQPGRKLAITSEKALTPQDLQDINLRIAAIGPKRIVVHAVSPNMLRVIETLRMTGLAERLYLVHHGAPAQWFHEPDRNAVFEACRLLERGVLRRLHILRSGFAYDREGIYKPLLLNKAPSFPEASILPNDRGSGEKIAFIPGWSGWRKNIYANAYAATLSPEVDQAVLYANDVNLPDRQQRKLRFLSYSNRSDTMKMMVISDLVLNASLVDCHPMVNVESQGVGTPCIHGNLFLDALEGHEYCKITRVDDVNSVTEIMNRVRSCFDVPQDELRQITLDYQRDLDGISLARYGDFLEL